MCNEWIEKLPSGSVAKGSAPIIANAYRWDILNYCSLGQPIVGVNSISIASP